MTPILSPQQEQAVDAFASWLKHRHRPYFVLEGPPGSGKTTIAQKLADEHSGPVYFMAYTGAAAAVLRRKGIPAKTIHAYLYLPTGERQEEARELEAKLLTLDPNGDEKHIKKIRRRLEELYQPDFVKRPHSPFDPKGLIVADEMSMIGKREAEDLLSYGLPVLVLGDPNQLPPIEGKGYFGGRPDFSLTEIHRQALDSPILWLASQVLKGKTPAIGNYGSSSVIKQKDITKEIALGVSQIITGSNKARISFNKEVRQLKGFKGQFPLEGERVICKRNNSMAQVFNGQRYTVTEADHDGKFITMSIEDAEGEFGPINVHKQCFIDFDVIKSWSYEKRKVANEFDYGYAVTGHAMQGSQAPSVLIFADQFKWKPELWKQWLLTSITRAEDYAILAL